MKYHTGADVMRSIPADNAARKLLSSQGITWQEGEIHTEFRNGRIVTVMPTVHYLWSPRDHTTPWNRAAQKSLASGASVKVNPQDDLLNATCEQYEAYFKNTREKFSNVTRTVRCEARYTTRKER